MKKNYFAWVRSRSDDWSCMLFLNYMLRHSDAACMERTDLELIVIDWFIPEFGSVSAKERSESCPMTASMICAMVMAMTIRHAECKAMPQSKQSESVQCQSSTLLVHAKADHIRSDQTRPRPTWVTQSKIKIFVSFKHTLCMSVACKAVCLPSSVSSVIINIYLILFFRLSWCVVRSLCTDLTVRMYTVSTLPQRKRLIDTIIQIK